MSSKSVFLRPINKSFFKLRERKFTMQMWFYAPLFTTEKSSIKNI